MNYQNKSEIDWSEDFVILCRDIGERNEVLQDISIRGGDVEFGSSAKHHNFLNVVYRVDRKDYTATKRHTNHMNGSILDSTITSESFLLSLNTKQGKTKIIFNFLGHGV